MYVGSNGAIRRRLIEEIHGSATGGHSGILATYQRLKINLYQV